MPMSIDTIEYSLDRLDAEITQELYLIASGQKSESNTADTYACYASLFTVENIRHVQAAMTAPRDGMTKWERTRLARMALSLISGYVEAAVAPLRDTLEGQIRALEIPMPDGPVPYVRVSEKTDAITDPAQRRAAWKAAGDAVLSSLAPAGLQLWQARQRVARELGYRSYATMFARLKGINLNQLAHDTELVLAATEAPHRAALASALRTYAGVPIQEATTTDFRHVLRQVSAHTQVEGIDMMSAVRTTLAGMGIDLDGVSGLVYDLEDRPLKLERAAIYMINPPRHQIINCRPNAGSGLESLRTLLHETGHGLHFAHTDPDLPAAIRRNPDPIIMETMAYLLDGLLQEPAWLQEVLGLDAGRVRDILAVQRLRRYYLVRQTAGLCRYLLALDRDTSTRAAATYQQILSGATLVQMHPGGYAISPDPELYGVGYFYADVVTAQVTQSLRAAYGVQWWTSPACGQRLQQVWQHCSVGSPADLVRAFGHRYISLASLLRQLVDDGMDGAAFRVG